MLTANPDKSFVTAVCDFGVVSPPICKNDYVMVLAAFFGCDCALDSWAPILDRKQI